MSTTTCTHGVSISEAYGMLYPLTPCCGASATGSMGVVACRSCYAEVDPMLGDCAMVIDRVVDDVARVRAWFAEQGCPTATECSEAALDALVVK